MRAFINETRMDVTCLRCGEPFDCTELDGFPPEFFEGVDVFTCCDPCVEQMSAEYCRRQGMLKRISDPEEESEESSAELGALFHDLVLI